jgi:hypothetical protein
MGSGGLMKKGSKATKPYIVEFEHRDGYLYAHAQAEKDSLDIAVGYWTDIATYCRDNGFSRLLVERDVGTQNSLGDTYEIVSKVHEVGLTDVKIAFIDRRPDHLEPDLFGETIALNRGIYCKVLKNFGEAEAWLLSK